MQAVIGVMPNIPVRKHSAHDKSMYRPKKLPDDHWRKYDEACMFVNKRIQAKGYVGTTDYLQDACRQNLMGYLLGFIWGLQYSHDHPTECFTNIEYTLLSLDDVVGSLYYAFLPDQWGYAMISWTNLVDLTSSLYGNCQIQQFLAMAPTFLTYEGLSALSTRTTAGLQAEIPLFYTKMQSSNQCTSGEAAGKLSQLILSWNI